MFTWPRLGIRLFAFALVIAASTAWAAAAPRTFPIYEAMLFSGKPNLATYGVNHIRVVDSHELWKPGGDTQVPPDAEQIGKIVAGGPGAGNLLVIDIEEWDLAAAKAPESVRKYNLTLDRFRSAARNWRFGLYGVLPDRDYWRAIGPANSAQYRAWQAGNDRIAAVASHVDVLFPSLYTFYSDQEGWVRYAIANLREARRLAPGKPVYCFLWMQFHDSSVQPYALLTADYWLRELKTCRQYADGIVMWGGFTIQNGKFEPLRWDDNAPWWRATLEFLRG